MMIFQYWRIVRKKYRNSYSTMNIYKIFDILVLHTKCRINKAIWHFIYDSEPKTPTNFQCNGIQQKINTIFVSLFVEQRHRLVLYFLLYCLIKVYHESIKFMKWQYLTFHLKRHTNARQTQIDRHTYTYKFMTETTIIFRKCGSEQLYNFQIIKVSKNIFNFSNKLE